MGKLQACFFLKLEVLCFSLFFKKSFVPENGLHKNTEGIGFFGSHHTTFGSTEFSGQLWKAPASTKVMGISLREATLSVVSGKVKKGLKRTGVVFSNIFMESPLKSGKIPILTHIFQGVETTN